MYDRIGVVGAFLVVAIITILVIIDFAKNTDDGIALPGEATTESEARNTRRDIPQIPPRVVAEVKVKNNQFSSELTTILVKRNSGEPAKSAKAWIAPFNTRSVNVERCFTANTKGEIFMSASELDASGVLCITASDHQISRIGKPKFGTRSEITLLPSIKQEIRVVDVQGNSIVDARVLLSPFLLFRGTEVPEFPAPGADARFTIHSQRSDSDGRIVFSNLAPGRYNVSVRCEGFRLDDARPIDTITVPSAPVEFRMFQVWAAVIKHEVIEPGSLVLAYRDRKIVAPLRTPTAFDSARRRLWKEFPNHTVFVLSPAIEWLQRNPKKENLYLVGSALAKDGMRREVRVQFSPISSLHEPTSIDLGEGMGNVREIRTTIHIVDISGRRFSDIALMLKSKNGKRYTHSGHAIAIPVGRYQILTSNQLVAPYLSEEKFLIDESVMKHGSELEIKVSCLLSTVKVKVMAPWGRIPLMGFIAVSQGNNTLRINKSGGDDLVVSLPREPNSRITVRQFGFDSAMKELSVTEESHAIEIDVTPKR